jgi:hypothetical protein
LKNGVKNTQKNNIGLYAGACGIKIARLPGQ